MIIIPCKNSTELPNQNLTECCCNKRGKGALFVRSYYIFQSLIQDVIFPLMCHSDEDDDLWNNDPHEYIRVKYGV